MRITNKIMQRNSLSNINSNKELQDNLTTQMSTQKKINRASDDPVVAIRALRLRSNVTEVTQYYSKNIPDADSWLKVTEDALKNTSEIITKMIEQSTRGSNGDLTSDDRKIIIEQLNALGDEVYKTGDASYAGRYVFTGYRTDTSLSFQEDRKDKTYNITEQLDKSVIDSITHIYTDAIDGWTSANFSSAAMSGVTEVDITQFPINRIRLAYNNLDDIAAADIKINYTDTAGNPQSLTATNVGLSTDPATYDVFDSTNTSYNPDAIVLVRDTGELLIGENAYAALMATRDNPSTPTTDESEIRITYEKTDFTADDLRPEHYYACSARDAGTALGDTSQIDYNQDYLNGIVEKQSIEYDVGFNQTIKINSTADEAYNLGIGREVDDLVSALQRVQNMEDLRDNIKKKLDITTNDADKDVLQNQLDTAEKALAFEKEVCQKRFERSITTFQKYLDDASLAITNVGTRSSKLELIQSRMQNQKTTFETLRSENEDIDITEVAIQLSSSEMTYQAALTATGKIIQNTLLNYI